jgi:uncharacterized protein (TIGR00369 family)
MLRRENVRTFTRPSPLMSTVPAGFRPFTAAGDFIAVNGPLYLRHEGDLVQLGFRVELRHTNPFGMCHGGMLASFCDMLLPISAIRKSAEVGMRFLPTINLQLDYLAPVPLGAWVQGEAQVLRVTRSMVFAQGLVTADGASAVRVSGIFKIGPPFAGIGTGRGDGN